MNGRAVAPAAGTVLNALATGTGSAFAIDLETTATVELTDDGEVTAEIAGQPDADTTLVERCAEFTIAEHADAAGLDESTVGARVETNSDVPMASGLKSSSAAANATVMATLDALEKDYDYIIVDTPPSLNVLTDNALVATGNVVIPVIPEKLNANSLQIFREAAGALSNRPTETSIGSRLSVTVSSRTPNTATPSRRSSRHTLSRVRDPEADRPLPVDWQGGVCLRLR